MNMFVLEIFGDGDGSIMMNVMVIFQGCLVTVSVMVVLYCERDGVFHGYIYLMIMMMVAMVLWMMNVMG